MFNRVSSINKLVRCTMRGAPPLKRKNRIPVVHQAARPAEDAGINLDELPLKYKMTVEATADSLQARTGWTPAPDAIPELPFMVTRSHVSKSIPVYTSYKGGNTRVETVLRKVSGDISELVNDMSIVCDGADVEIRPGKLIVKGNYHWRLKLWLSRLGF